MLGRNLNGLIPGSLHCDAKQVCSILKKKNKQTAIVVRSKYDGGVEECIANHTASHSETAGIICFHSNTIFLEVVP